MAISRTRKEEFVSEYKGLLDQSSAIYIAEYKGLSVKQLEALRGVIREAGGTFRVAKNTLMRVALEQTDRPVPEDLLQGQTGISFALDEAPTLAKALLDYAKKEENFVLRGAVMETSVFGADDIKAIADLPSLDQIRAQLVGVLQGTHRKLLGVVEAPPRDLVSVINNGATQLINVLNAYANKEES